jgi:uncharacterized protein
MGFAESYGPWGLVLGASEGLGAAFARGLAGRGLHVVVVARRAEPLAEVAAGLRDEHGVEAREVAVDLGDPELLGRLREVTDDVEVGLVVHNATAVWQGPFLDEPADNLEAQVAVNVRAPLLAARHYGGLMVGRGRGGLVLMGSAAGLTGSAGIATYSATKAFDLTLAHALWAEWGPKGVDVLGVPAPAMDTPHFRQTYTDDPASLPEPPVAVDQVVDEVLGALGTEMEWVPGEKFREGIDLLVTLPRRQQVELMSANYAAVND